MKEFTGIIKDGSWELPLTQLRLRENYLKSLKDGTKVIESLRKEGKQKTWKQCKTQFGLAIKRIIDEFNNNGWDCSILYNLPKSTGVPVNEDMLQQYFYALFPTRNDEGFYITMSDPTWERTHSMAFFDNIRNYAASQWSIYIPDPDPNWKEST